MSSSIPEAVDHITGTFNGCLAQPDFRRADLIAPPGVIVCNASSAAAEADLFQAATPS